MKGQGIVMCTEVNLNTISVAKFIVINDITSFHSSS